MTAEEIQRLPWLLRRAQVMAITGWSEATLYKMVRCGQLNMQLTPGKQRRFRKCEILGMIGMMK